MTFFENTGNVHNSLSDHFWNLVNIKAIIKDLKFKEVEFQFRLMFLG